MPQHKSAKKRLRQSDRKKTVNKAVKSNVSTQLKAIDKLIKDKKVEESMAKLKVVMSVLHKSTKKKIEKNHFYSQLQQMQLHQPFHSVP